MFSFICGLQVLTCKQAFKLVVMSSVLNSSGCLVVYVDKIFEVGIEVDLHLYADKRRFLSKL